MKNKKLSHLILVPIFFLLVQIHGKGQTIECHDSDYKFLWRGELIEDESKTYTCGSNLPEIIEIVYANGQQITFTVTWTGLVDPNGTSLDPGQAQVKLEDFGSNPYTEANITGEFLDGSSQLHSLSIRILYLGPIVFNPNFIDDLDYNYEYDRNKQTFYPTYFTDPEPGIPIKLISNLKGSYSDKLKYRFKSEEIAAFGELFCDDPNLEIFPSNNFLKEGEVELRYSEELTTSTLELNLWDCGEIPTMKVFLGKPIEKKVDFVYVGRDLTHKPSSFAILEVIEHANSILNRVGINLTLGEINVDIPIFYVPEISSMTNYDWVHPPGILTTTEQLKLHEHYFGSDFWKNDYLVMIVEDLGGTVFGAATSDGGPIEARNSLALDAFDIAANLTRGGQILAHEIGHAAYALYHVNQVNVFSPIHPNIDGDWRNLMYDSSTPTTMRLNAFQFKIIHTIR